MKYETKNPPDWLKGDLHTMYVGTEGACGSPDPFECYLLHELAKQTEGNALEFGSWRGRSSCFIASGLKNTLYCVDHFKGDTTGGIDPDKQKMIQTLQKFKINNVVLYDTDMFNFDNYEFENVDFVFYDSDHNTEPTVNLLTKIHPRLNEGCIVAIHDAGWDMTQRAIERLSDLYTQIEYYNVWEGFAILRKI